MNEPRPLLLSSFDAGGGAARAALRLHRAFLNEGILSTMAVELGTTGAERVVGPEGSWKRGLARTRPVLDRSPLLLYRGRRAATFSPAWLPGGGARALSRVKHNVVNLHWINAGFLSVEAVGKAAMPIVWTLHDMWPMTGGCHQSEGCEAFKAACGACPQLGSHHQLDLSRFILRRKQRSWDADQMTVVAPSRWLADAASESSVFRGSRIEVIPNVVDTERFRPIAKALAREVLGLPADKALVGFGAANLSDPQKGAALLRATLKEVSRSSLEFPIEVVTFGAGDAHGDSWAFPVHRLGRLHDDVTMALLYSALDFVVQPSMAEAQGLVVAEAMACGTPAIAFATTGLKELITSEVDGIVATPFEISSLAEGIRRLANDQSLRERLGGAARHRIVAEFSPTAVVSQYGSLFSRLLRPVPTAQGLDTSV